MRKTLISFKIKLSTIERNQYLDISLIRNQNFFLPCGKIKVEYSIYDAYNKKVYSLQTSMFGETGHTRVKIKHSGYYILKIEKFYCFDILQCLFIKHKTNHNLSFYVFPLLVSAHLNLDKFFSFHQDSLDYSPYHSGDDYTEVFDFREYQEGDNLNHVHWNLSSKRGQLHVKVGSQPHMKRLLLCLEQSSSKEANDKALDLFYSLAIQLLKNGVVFEIICPYDAKDFAHIELIQDEFYFKECLMKIMQSPMKSKSEILQATESSLDIVFVNEKGTESK